MIRGGWLALVLLAGCRHPSAAPAPVVGELRARFEAVMPSSLPAPSEQALTVAVQRAAEAVGAPRVAVPPPPGAPLLRLTVEVELGWATPKLKSIVRARLEPIGTVAAAARIDREALVEKEGVVTSPDAEVVRAHVEHALALVVGAAMRGEQLWLGPAEQARAPLSGADDELRDEALRIAAERHDRLAVPLILPLLQSEDPDERDRVIGALGEIGDPRAAHALAARAKFGDVEQLVKILDAISRVGGPEAESYLELVATGHPQAEIRALAARALEHLRTRGRDGGG